MIMMVATVMVLVLLLLLLQVELLSVKIVYTISQTTVLSAAIQHGLSMALIVLH